jgi:hypothetical protein
MGSSVRTTRVLCLSVWLSAMTCWERVATRAIVSRSAQSVVGREQFVDVTGHPQARVDQHDELVTDPLQVSDEM